MLGHKNPPKSSADKFQFIHSHCKVFRGKVMSLFRSQTRARKRNGKRTATWWTARSRSACRVGKCIRSQSLRAPCTTTTPTRSSRWRPSTESTRTTGTTPSIWASSPTTTSRRSGHWTRRSRFDVSVCCWSLRSSELFGKNLTEELYPRFLFKDFFAAKIGGVQWWSPFPV